jgi:hypothetical protein
LTKNWSGKPVNGAYIDKWGQKWIPQTGPNAHGGEHWDVQRKDGKGYTNLHPDGRVRGWKGKPPKLGKGLVRIGKVIGKKILPVAVIISLGSSAQAAINAPPGSRLSAFCSTFAQGMLVGDCYAIWNAYRNDDSSSLSPSEMPTGRSGRRDAIERSAGLRGGIAKGPVGVEFRPSELPFFPWSAADEGKFVTFLRMDNPNEVLTTANLLVGSTVFYSVQQVFDTILAEVTSRVSSGAGLPFISLHFNRDALLYSVIDPGYDGTLTGLVLTFLDFHMKSFVNGGFFHESFLRKWNGTTDLNFLNYEHPSTQRIFEKVGSRIRNCIVS